jgi:hypothetical protein
MKKLILTIFSLALVMTGCAYNQQITLPIPKKNLNTQAKIIINDERNIKDKETILNAMGEPCFRSYGDSFIKPSKITFLEEYLENTLMSESNIDITITKLETTEHCELSHKRGQNAAVEGALIGATGNSLIVSNMPKGERDYFELNIQGTINSHPFTYKRYFDFSDISYWNFPSDSEEYQRRILECFSGFSNDLQLLIK